MRYLINYSLIANQLTPSLLFKFLIGQRKGLDNMKISEEGDLNMSVKETCHTAYEDTTTEEWTNFKGRKIGSTDKNGCT